MAQRRPLAERRRPRSGGRRFRRFAAIAIEAPRHRCRPAVRALQPRGARGIRDLARQARATPPRRRPPPRPRGPPGKYRSLLPALALICHLADHPVSPVDHLAFCRAEAWIEYLETHARRIYDALLRSDQTAARALGEHINDLPSPFRLRDVYRPCWAGLTTKEAAQEAVDTLADLGWLRVEQPKSGKSGGRPAALYHVNPKLRKSAVNALNRLREALAGRVLSVLSVPRIRNLKKSLPRARPIRASR